MIVNETNIQIYIYEILDPFCKSESPSFDSLNERFYDPDNVPKIFSGNSHGNMSRNLTMAKEVWTILDCI